MMNRQDDDTAVSEEVYNIIPLDNLSADHPCRRFPEVRLAIAALHAIGGLRRPPQFLSWNPDYDLLDWLGLHFGFQSSNVKNQREHLVLHLSNAQMRLFPTPDNLDSLDPSIVRNFRCQLLKNYSDWCSYLGIRPNLLLSDSCSTLALKPNVQHELLYVSLYLLIWGESANLRLVPECICYIFHHMAMELNKILEDYIDDNTGRPFLTSLSRENAFLNQIVKPIYYIMKVEVENSRNGTAPHSVWRNYDDINEYFWSRRCFKELKWPIDVSSTFFMTSNKEKVEKTGFVEQRSFWNIFQSFHKLWAMLILFIQAAVIVAWEEKGNPWEALKSTEVQARCLTVFFTWSAMRFLHSLLYAAMHYSLVSREMKWLGMRMVLKVVVSAGWVWVFMMFYGRIWDQRSSDGRWSPEVNLRVVNFCRVALVFMAPELLALVLFILPCVGNYLENTNWRIFRLLSWWFQGRTFVGRGLREEFTDSIKYIIFWIIVLGTKFSYSYFLQIKPMIGSTKTLLHTKNINYEWLEFFKHSNRFALGLLWLPVVLIYLMDLQIWFSIYSTFLGTTIGLFNRLGEIRNMHHLRFWFQYFASAICFNLLPEEKLLNARGTYGSKFREAIHQLKLRYGFGRPFRKLEPNQVEAYKFAMIWNEIIMTFREEDIISDHEIELLEMPIRHWKIRVIQWPCVFLCNEVLLALRWAKKLSDAPDERLWYKISKNEHRRCAVIEAYDSVREFLLTIVKNDSEEHSIVETFFKEIDFRIQLEKFTKCYKMVGLEKIHEKLIHLLNLVLKLPVEDLNEVVNALQALYEAAIRDFSKEYRDIYQLREDGLFPRTTILGERFLFEKAVELPSPDNEGFYRCLRRLHTILTSEDSMLKIPESHEARRRISFFSNSMFMNIPRASLIEKMAAFSVLTPYYKEEVLYSMEQLRIENDDGISILYYLQTIHADEWRNFLERMRREGMVSERELWTTRLRDLRLWASYRGQTLARTTRGMMYYNRALNMLAFLDSTHEIDIMEGYQRLHFMKLNDSRDGLRSIMSSPPKTSVHEICIPMKFTYVVACQLYGTQKAEKDRHAEDILNLLKGNETLRVAYIDEVSKEKTEKEYYSVLVKYDKRLQREVEIYRIKLPGDPLKLGEGKPENQNHAIIFTRGDAIQTIDMNQDNYFEEALKMRNLLEEFKHSHGIKKPTILGLREHIFTGPVSSPAQFMCSQETSFVTLGQRIMANPLKIRMHYGHPDVFDRFWFLTRGGISKGSRVLNINEDIFAGFNCTLRRGNITHHEYIQFGKGRDVGFNQISMFEAKIASGSGEQLLSRDVYRLGNRLDFFRMLSFFYTSVGFFFNACVVVFALYTFWWGQFYLALCGFESSMKSGKADQSAALLSILNQGFVIELGLFNVLPMIVESTVEHGFLTSIWEFIVTQLQLSSLFYTFSLGTRSHYFGRTLLHGGAKYRETGRGFVVQHKSFTESYRLYARSHFVKAIELGLLLAVYSLYSPVVGSGFVYLALTLASWFLVASWILSPFIFNPLSFEWLKTVNDFHEFINWIWYRASILANAEQSWEKWWYEEQDHLRTTSIWGKVTEIILNLRFFFFQYAMVYKLSIAAGSNSIAVYLRSWIFILVLLGVYAILTRTSNKYSIKAHFFYRFIQTVFFVLTIFGIIALRMLTNFKFLDLLKSLLVFIPTGWGLISIALVLRPFLEKSGIWDSVVSFARVYEIMFGVIVMSPVAVLSWLPWTQHMQTRILFNEAFSRGLHISQILAGTRGPAKSHVV
ncbi:callose synthase 12-like [Olea europaea var. sylvestris]|uniref:callose synthase 12-like n=1 Tax=Olea europaea var. sylvestris TaxID=158386 RepID=UPI000C1D3BCC|nr:callose synthase 12-like [Olea europaea var. sylvestris]